jgi:hypothetical protein
MSKWWLLTSEFYVRGKFWGKEPYMVHSPPLSVVSVSNSYVNGFCGRYVMVHGQYICPRIIIGRAYYSWVVDLYSSWEVVFEEEANWSDIILFILQRRQGELFFFPWLVVTKRFQGERFIDRVGITSRGVIHLPMIGCSIMIPGGEIQLQGGNHLRGSVTLKGTRKHPFLSLLSKGENDQ